jgi:hypothetical protein
VGLSAARMGVPSCPASQHQEPRQVNPDASLFVGNAAGRDNAAHARHVCGDLGGSLDSAARQRAVCCAGSVWRSLAHSRCCRGRSTDRSAPARSSVRKDTGAGLPLPVCRRAAALAARPAFARQRARLPRRQHREMGSKSRGRSVSQSAWPAEDPAGPNERDAARCTVLTTLPTPMHRDTISGRRPSRPQISFRHD